MFRFLKIWKPSRIICSRRENQVVQRSEAGVIDLLKEGAIESLRNAVS